MAGALKHAKRSQRATSHGNREVFNQFARQAYSIKAFKQAQAAQQLTLGQKFANFNRRLLGK